MRCQIGSPGNYFYLHLEACKLVLVHQFDECKELNNIANAHLKYRAYRLISPISLIAYVMSIEFGTFLLG